MFEFEAGCDPTFSVLDGIESMPHDRRREYVQE
jgi:hypothetical protein